MNNYNKPLPEQKLPEQVDKKVLITLFYNKGGCTCLSQSYKNKMEKIKKSNYFLSHHPIMESTGLFFQKFLPQKLFFI